MSQMDGPGFDIGAAFQVWADMRDGIRSLNKRWTAKPQVLSSPISAQASSGSSGNLLFEIGGPGAGRRWLVRKIIVGGALVTATPAGTAYVVVAGTPPDPANMPLANVVDLTANALPQKAFYGRGELIVDYPERLSVLIASPTATTQYVAVAWVEDYESGFALDSQAP